MRFLATLILTALLPLNSASAVDVPLLCAKKIDYTLRTSNVIKGCSSDELPLGEGALLEPSTPVSNIDPLLLIRFEAAKAAAAKDGVKLYLVSGYRSIAHQRELFAAAIKKYGSYREAAKWVLPGELSHHPMGLAMDINYPNDPEGAKWLEVNGYRFGLCRVFKNEWWHFEGNIAPGWKCPKMHKSALALLKG
jgi:D-alanyl-D-alanine carboxypeptidase